MKNVINLKVQPLSGYYIRILHDFINPRRLHRGYGKTVLRAVFFSHNSTIRDSTKESIQPASSNYSGTN